MSRKTKIFISSSSQPELKSIRQRSFDHLSLLGHEPLIFESNMGPWHSQIDMVQNCIEYVKSSDLFVLFVANITGTYMTEDDITVTHLELETAYENKKICTVFVEQFIYELFFETIRRKIGDALTIFNEANHKEPESLYRQIILPLKEELPNDVEAIEEHNRYWGFTTKFMGMVKMGNPDDQTWKEFLHTLQISLKGGTVEYLKGKYRREVLGAVENCSGSTLYRIDNSLLVR